MSLTTSAPLDTKVHQHLERWRDTVDPNAEGRWERRLAWDDFDEEDALQSAVDVLGIDDAEPFGPFADAYDGADHPFVWTDRVLDDSPPPFAHLSVPAIRAARGHLANQAVDALASLSDSALADLERGLLLRLTSILGQAAYGAFSPLRDQQRSIALSMLLGGGAPTSPDSTYRAFVNAMVRGATRSAPRTLPRGRPALFDGNRDVG